VIYNPYIQGWINYYDQFYRKQLRPTLMRIDTYVIRSVPGRDLMTKIGSIRNPQRLPRRMNASK
jgi:hypothetical protein